MTGWPMQPLAALAAPERGSITDGPFGSNLTSAHYTQTGPLVVRLQNIGDGYYKDAPARISVEHFRSLAKHDVRAGDLLIASLGEALPRACLAPETLGPAIVKADCIRVRLADGVDGRWVVYALQRPQVRRWVQERMHGVGRPRLGLRLIREIPVPLPEPWEQRRIVDLLELHLSNLASAESTARSAARMTASFRSACMNHVIDSYERRRPLGGLLTRIEAGRSFNGSTPPAKRDEWGIIKVSSMTWGEFRPEENKAVPADRIDPRDEVRPGDLLLSRANTSAYVGASVLVEDTRPRLVLSDKSLRLVPHEQVDPAWLQMALSAPGVRRQISNKATGTKDSMRNISQAALLEVEVPDRSLGRQRADAARCRDLLASGERMRSAADEAVRRSATLRRALLTAAFSGRLAGRSSDVDRVEELVG